MADKQLKDKAINIKGKEYVLVSDRVLYFNEMYPKGSIQTELISAVDSDFVVVKAKIFPDDSDRFFTGYSQAKWGDGYINKTSALENAETSAVGRALAMMGIGVIESIASVDEINKATNQSKAKFADAKEITELRRAANNVTGIDSAEELDAWIEQAIGMKPNMVFKAAVRSSIARIYAKKPKDAPLEQEEIVHEVKTPDNFEVTDKDLEDLKNGNLAY